MTVVPYDGRWPAFFERIRSRAWPALKGIATRIEHVGSTSVPGLAAKPVIDVSVVVPGPTEVPEAIARLATVGYVHRGTLGIPDREAFDGPEALPDHHLYVCPRDSVALANHLAVRDHLRANPDAAREYGALKVELARRFPDDMESYVEGKTVFLTGVLRAAGLPEAYLAEIERANRRP